MSNLNFSNMIANDVKYTTFEQLDYTAALKHLSALN